MRFLRDAMSALLLLQHDSQGQAAFGDQRRPAQVEQLHRRVPSAPAPDATILMAGPKLLAPPVQ